MDRRETLKTLLVGTLAGGEEFLSNGELSLLAILCDIILPANDSAGSASDAGCHDFINFIAKDIPSKKTPIRGGIAWLDSEARMRYGKSFIDVTETERLEIIDEIAWPDKVKEGKEAGAKFFNEIRNLTLTGYYTTKMGIDDLGYVGNRPNVWDGVPAEVLKDHDVDYDPEWIAKCVDQSKRDVTAEWDENGNLLT